MPGSLIIKPIEANITSQSLEIEGCDPYCHFIVGDLELRGPICKKGGAHPFWHDSIRLPLRGNTSEFTMQIKHGTCDDADDDDHIASCNINIDEVKSKGKLRKWYSLKYDGESVGDILLDSVYLDDDVTHE